MPDPIQKSQALSGGGGKPAWICPALIAAFLLMASCDSASTTMQPVTEGAVSPQTTSAAANATPENPSGAGPYLGDTVEESGYLLTALAVADPATPTNRYKAKAGQRLVAVDVIVGNLSGGDTEANALNGTLLDTSGNIYQPRLGAVADELNALPILPGEQTVGWLAFSIPDDAKPAFMEVSFAQPGKDVVAKTGLNKPPVGHTAVRVALTPTAPATKVGNAVMAQGYSLLVMQVQDSATPAASYIVPKGFKLVAVQFELKNVAGSDYLSVIAVNASLVDSRGFVYGPELGSIDGQIQSGKLGAGDTATGWLAFQLPADSSPLYLQYEPVTLTDNYLITGLTK